VQYGAKGLITVAVLPVRYRSEIHEPIALQVRLPPVAASLSLGLQRAKILNFGHAEVNNFFSQLLPAIQAKPTS
jgi:hypothetical protein